MGCISGLGLLLYYGSPWILAVTVAVLVMPLSPFWAWISGLATFLVTLKIVWRKILDRGATSSYDEAGGPF